MIRNLRLIKTNVPCRSELGVFCNEDIHRLSPEMEQFLDDRFSEEDMEHLLVLAQVLPLINSTFKIEVVCTFKSAGQTVG